MVDIFSKKKRSEIMSKIGGENTSIELLMKDLMKKNNIVGFERGNKIFGKPDMVFNDKKIAIFFDGGFWHGREFHKIKNKLAPFWKEKISKNMLRDREVSKRLKKDGWKVLRFWDIQIKKYPERCVKKIYKLVS